MTAARYALGLAALTVTVGSALWSAVQVRRRALPRWWGAVARLAEGVVALAEVIAVEEALGAVGLFRRGTVLVTIVVAALTLGLLCRRGLERRVPPPRLREEHGERRTSAPVGATAAVAAAAAAAAVTLVACQWGLRTLDVLQHGMSNVDSLWFHLPFAAQAVQHGWLTHPHFTDVDPLTTYLPSTPELFHGLGMLAFGRDSLSPLLNALWLPPTLLAAWCVGARRGLGHLSLVGGALLLASPLLVTTQPGQATTDTAALFFLLAAFAFLLNGAWETSAVVLAAVATGLAVSSKLSLLAPAAALSLGVVLLNRRRRPALALAWVLPLAVSGGYWYARNLAVTGNPLPWLKLGIGD